MPDKSEGYLTRYLFRTSINQVGILPYFDSKCMIKHAHHYVLIFNKYAKQIYYSAIAIYQQYGRIKCIVHVIPHIDICMHLISKEHII